MTGFCFCRNIMSCFCIFNLTFQGKVSKINVLLQNRYIYIYIYSKYHTNEFGSYLLWFCSQLVCFIIARNYSARAELPLRHRADSMLSHLCVWPLLGMRRNVDYIAMFGNHKYCDRTRY